MTARVYWMGALAAIVASSCGARKSAKSVAGEAPMAAPHAGDMAGGDADDGQMAADPADAVTVESNKDSGPAKAAAIDGEREFAAPSYGKSEVRRDFRETIFWAPSVKTDKEGHAEVTFQTNDSVTTFRATAEGIGGGVAGRGESSFASVLPLSVAAKLPTEVTPGDRLRVPVTVTNRTERGKRVSLVVSRGEALTIRGAKPTVWVPAGKERTVAVTIGVAKASRAPGAGFIKIAATAGKYRDVLSRELTIAPPGFPREVDHGGILEASVSHKVALPSDVVPGTLEATISFFPSPTSALMGGVESIVREPHGCFEQASSANYPNVMALSYMKQNNALEAAVVEKAKGPLERGYKKLVGYESDNKGFEWFGGDPGHEALTAYGLMQFKEMAKVYPQVDTQMVRRTASWLKSRRDGSGGYKRNKRALDSFGRASDDVTNSYITFALTEAGETNMPAELGKARSLAKSTKDPYVLALVTNSLLNAAPNSADTKAAVTKLAAMQADDGKFDGAKESITRSGGKALAIETTSLAAMALLKSKGAERKRAGKSLRWIQKQRNGRGGFASTQSTVLALKALTSETAASSVFEPGSSVEVLVGGRVVDRVVLRESSSEPVRYTGLAKHLATGDNHIELRARGKVRLSYSLGVSYRQSTPATSAASAVSIKTRLAKRRVRAGRSVPMHVSVTNNKAEGIPMVIARVGIPGGLTFQRWQLDELVNKGKVDFYETRAREVILYWRSMAPSAVHALDVHLLAAVPGRYSSQPSPAYLYYTDEHKHFAPATQIVVTKSVFRKKKSSTKSSKESARVSQ